MLWPALWRLGADLKRSFSQKSKQPSDSSDASDPKKGSPADDEKHHRHDMFINVFPPPSVMNVV
jgi:hypothetical protein